MEDDSAPDGIPGAFAPPGATWLDMPEGVLLALAVVISLLLILTPACAFAFARANLRANPSERVLFGSAMVSSGATTLWMTVLALFPGLTQVQVLQTTVLPFATLFFWAWTLLDFIRGVRAVGLRPRRWAVSAIVLGVLAVLIFVVPVLAPR